MKLLTLLSFLFAVWSTGSTNTKPLSLTIPWSADTKANDYQCVAKQVPAEAKYLVKYIPRVNTTSVHHMLLFGCHLPYYTNQTWSCKAMSRLCGSRSKPYTMFGWGRNATGIQLPEGVGFKVGAGTDISWFVLQLHYRSQPSSTQSPPGLSVQLTDSEKESVAGIYLLAAYAYKSIPPTTDAVNFDLACQHHGNPIVPIAFRVHAHSLGIKITGYVVKNGEKDWVKLGSKSPQDPQAFYPIENSVTVTEGDYLAARCVYSSVGVTHTVHMGPDTTDEMCNFYIMFSTTNNPSAVTDVSCSQPAKQSLVFPDEEEEDDYECPSAVPPLVWQKKEAKLKVDDQWALNNVSGNGAMSVLGLSLGQVTSVQARNGHVYILHRGVVVWDEKSFDRTNHYTGIADGPIKQSTVLQLNSTGHLIAKWGENKLYMPHGLTIDAEGNYWITDVAMHQVFKFSPQYEQLLELGVKFTPGNDHSHFCKPASVAVDAATGVVFVADGYCNSRVVVFSPTGQYVMEQGAAVNNIALNVVHKLVIVEKLDQLLVADRENGRILAYQLQDLHLLWSMVLPELGGKVYSIDVNCSAGEVHLFAVSTGSGNGITYDQSGVVLDEWGAHNAKFLNPHDVAMDTDFSAVYVVEIGPNRIWKFAREAKADSTTRLSIIPTSVSPSLSTTPAHSSSSSTSSSHSLSVPIPVTPSLSITSSTSLITHFVSIEHVTSTRSSSSSDNTVKVSHSTSTVTSMRVTSSIPPPLSSTHIKTSSSSSSKTQAASQSLSSAASSSSPRPLPSVHTKHLSKSRAVHPSTSTKTTHSTPEVTPSSFHTRADNSDLKVVAVVLTVLVLLAGLLVVCLTVKYCNNGNWSRRSKMDLRKKASQLFNTNGHRGFTKVRTFDPDASDGDEMTIFSKM